ncbi:MAG: C/D box methylation guide ribonucleoprotein complex aNOP56 subunit [Desulfurococcales archaeon ex4484_217_1]|nr:MAG: C/D box methylation guide ribonucleoprotein complex aNOP56 subunit [Desulfurococcales archaeon ex4484_217_1]
MKVYLVDHTIGVFAFDEKGNVVAYEVAKGGLDEVIEHTFKIERGKASKLHEKVLDKLLKIEGVEKVIVEDERLAKIVASKGLDVKIESGNSIARAFRENVVDYAVKYGFAASPEEYYSKMHEVSVVLTRRKVRKAVEKRDLLAAQGVRAIDDIDRTVNLFIARLREWYSLHFPELDDLIREHEDYTRLVYELGLRENFTKENLVKLGFSEGKARRIEEAARKSMGADITDFDIKTMQTLAGIILKLYRLRADIAQYIGEVMREVAPNITALVGPLLGARLISLAGGLDELARLPASTIQVLGAEKALFRALRTGGKPPKHGIIFQFPDIHRSPRWQRGKIARALAGKLAIAARVDAFTGQYIGDQLKETLKKRIEEIKKLYPKPPRRREEFRPRRRREKPRRRK